jgi:hypothetical protein
MGKIGGIGDLGLWRFSSIAHFVCFASLRLKTSFSLLPSVNALCPELSLFLPPKLGYGECAITNRNLMILGLVHYA